MEEKEANHLPFREYSANLGNGLKAFMKLVCIPFCVFILAGAISAVDFIIDSYSYSEPRVDKYVRLGIIIWLVIAGICSIRMFKANAAFLKLLQEKFVPEPPATLPSPFSQFGIVHINPLHPSRILLAYWTPQPDLEIERLRHIIVRRIWELAALGFGGVLIPVILRALAT